MRHRLVCLTLLLASFSGGDLIACGDKFLVAGRGTRYQRPKTARAASVLIYAAPSSQLTALGNMHLEPLLKQQGHRPTTVQTFEQLSNVIAAGRFDVVIAAASVAASVEQLLVGASETAVVLAFETAPRGSALLKAIDKAVVQHDVILKARKQP